MSEYRTWITVPDLPLVEEGAWEPLITRLEEEQPHLGSVISWEGRDAVLVLSMEAGDEAAAAEIGVAAVSNALRSAGLGDRYPSGVEVEPVANEPDPALR